jgi:hypothetical protein
MVLSVDTGPNCSECLTNSAEVICSVHEYRRFFQARKQRLFETLGWYLCRGHVIYPFICANL